MRRGSGLNVLGVIFGILSILIVIAVGAILLGKQPFRLPLDFKLNLHMDQMEEMFSNNASEELVKEEFHNNFNSIIVENIAGNIEIEGWNQDFIELEYLKSAPDQKYLDNLVVEIEENGRTLKIERDFIGEGITPRGKIDFRIHIPREKISDIYAKSVNGRVVCIQMSSETDQKLQTTSGRIETDAGNNLFVKTISGEIKFTSSGKKIEVRSTSGRVEGDYRPVNRKGNIDIHTVSGAVLLTLPDKFQGDIDLRSISGSVSSDFQVDNRSSKRNSLEGRIGDGGVEIDINTTTGSIRLNKATGDE
jgi:hypothetical protein